MFANFASFAFFLFALLLVYIRPKPLKGIPLGGPMHWAFGHYPWVLGNLAKDQFLTFQVEMTEKYQRTWQLVFPFNKVVVKVVTPECIQHVVKTNMDNYAKAVTKLDIDMWQELIGREGMLISYGQDWVQKKKKVIWIFSVKMIREVMMDRFLKNAQIVCDKFAALKSGESIDIQDLFLCYTMDSFCEFALGVNTNSLTGGMNEFSHAFDDLQHILFLRYMDRPILFAMKKFFRVERERRAKADQVC
jgi:hypothetical protein